jgi:hypothetical protein
LALLQLRSCSESGRWPRWPRCRPGRAIPPLCLSLKALQLLLVLVVGG